MKTKNKIVFVKRIKQKKQKTQNGVCYMHELKSLLQISELYFIL